MRYPILIKEKCIMCKYKRDCVLDNYCYIFKKGILSLKIFRCTIKILVKYDIYKNYIGVRPDKKRGNKI
jgi:hypothetical protein